MIVYNATHISCVRDTVSRRPGAFSRTRKRLIINTYPPPPPRRVRTLSHIVDPQGLCVLNILYQHLPNSFGNIPERVQDVSGQFQNSFPEFQELIGGVPKSFMGIPELTCKPIN
ncbi:MAG: hypothetical protein LBG96_13755 [Tannerella sp.]|nr:hypothetical protein [Tannerella sp.]